MIDPLDGTLAFVRGVSRQFGVALAFINNEKIQYSAVYEPMDKELFFAKAGGGAFLNGKRISIYTPDDLRFANIYKNLNTL